MNSARPNRNDEGFAVNILVCVLCVVCNNFVALKAAQPIEKFRNVLYLV